MNQTYGATEFYRNIFPTNSIPREISKHNDSVLHDDSIKSSMVIAQRAP